MARVEQDREDLMVEATALIRRVELQWPVHSEPCHSPTCIVGFRRTGEASMFVGADTVFQFNAAGELRRGFSNGRLVKAEGGRLVQLERRRTDAETQLVRHELNDPETASFLRSVEETLSLLRRMLLSGELVVLKRVPAEFNVEHLADLLNLIPEPLKIASAPNLTS